MTAMTTARLARPAATSPTTGSVKARPSCSCTPRSPRSRQLRALAARLAERHRVVAVDRRGSGDSAPPPSKPVEPIDVAVHVADMAALIDAEALAGCVVVGHSYGGCLALELAARRPDPVAAVWAYEPPYGPLAPPAVRSHTADVGRRTWRPPHCMDVRLLRKSSWPASPGRQPWMRCHRPDASASAERGRCRGGRDVAGPGRGRPGSHRCPVAIATGVASQSLYVAIAEALAEHIPGAVVSTIPGVDHMAPVTRPDIIAAAVEAFIDR